MSLVWEHWVPFRMHAEIGVWGGRKAAKGRRGWCKSISQPRLDECSTGFLGTMTAVPLLLVAFIVHGVAGAQVQPGIGCFEQSLQVLAADAAQQSPHLDVRVAKARGDRGYTKVRISVISHSPLPPDWFIHAGSNRRSALRSAQGACFAMPGTDIAHDPDHLPIKRRSSTDGKRPSILGQPRQHPPYAPEHPHLVSEADVGYVTQVKCSAGVFSKTQVQYDADCMLACTGSEACEFYTWFPSSHACELATANCKPPAFTPAQDAQATYRKLGANFLSSAIVELTPGKTNHILVGHHPLRISLPSQGSGVRGIVLADPCFSSRWITCDFGERWDAFNRTVLLLNALAQKGDVDFFALLGDNFYDQVPFLSLLPMRPRGPVWYHATRPLRPVRYLPTHLLCAVLYLPTRCPVPRYSCRFAAATRCPVLR